MKMLFTSHPGFGHVNPMIALALRLVASGDNDVFYATSRRMARHIEMHGIATRQVGLDWSESEVEQCFPDMASLSDYQKSLWWEDMLWRRAPEAAIPALIDLIHSEQPDLILVNAYDWSGAIAAEACGVPHALVSVSARVPNMKLEALFSERYQRLRKQAGLAADSEFSKLRRWLELSFMPKSWSLPNYTSGKHEHFFRPLLFDNVPSKPETALMQGLQNGKPNVYVTMGTVSNRNVRVFETIAEALASMECNAVVTTGGGVDPAHLQAIAKNVHVVDYLPQSQVLPHMDLCICHGGVSTALGALSEGVPLVLLPLGADQPINTQVCERNRVGVSVSREAVKQLAPGMNVIAPENLRPEHVQQAVQAVLDMPEFAMNARKIAREISNMPDHDEVHVLLNSLAEHKKTDKTESQGMNNASV